MLVTDLILGTILTILFFLVGILIGWVSREYMFNYQETPKLHPEFYDQNGNIIPDEILAIRVEHDYDYYDEDDDDE